MINIHAILDIILLLPFTLKKNPQHNFWSSPPASPSTSPFPITSWLGRPPWRFSPERGTSNRSLLSWGSALTRLDAGLLISDTGWHNTSEDLVCATSPFDWACSAFFLSSCCSSSFSLVACLPEGWGVPALSFAFVSSLVSLASWLLLPPGPSSWPR